MSHVGFIYDKDISNYTNGEGKGHEKNNNITHCLNVN